MVARAACREYFARFGAAFAMSCVIAMTAVAPAAAQTQGPPAPPPPRDAESAAAKAKEMVDPIKRCKPADDGSINVCGSDTDLHRLSPELRAIANEGREAPPKLPRAEAQAMTLDKLPYNWMSLGGRMKRGPEYNPLYEAVKRATDPETGTPPTPEEEP
ncbi:hypothetical protein ATE68_13085 [Sphingopyxis sp. H038]|nr:hypothetical protein ATE78_03330 [Sphingopyxis sp. H012]KTE07958.1 hypothetical protein ATE70_18305 [Sphingopyxis sp. H053]KTE13941.1 hypothetical protein ATE76_10330 [Sphingopyxis sp. H093]KTE23520.1 hypothetical protein ATE75_19365 [Sphingopyxis sp. H080]KTE34256.1 hypothetical protein ATE68_13085 [Sphingopyxis sp. H038]KTE38108.1 hypothetical protein ATE73_20725 [Sphingopyxis sp. H077]KTE42761.1 hypothetical protein ATE77_14570 [Sphingopyxis sp. H005]KTE62173.1 hypothetical protein ATE